MFAITNKKQIFFAKKVFSYWINTSDVKNSKTKYIYCKY